MKLIKLDVKKNTIIKPESTEDLYALYKIIKPGDIIGAKTFRTEQKTSKKQKVLIFLKIKIEKTGLSEQGNVLNLAGKIIEAKDIIQKGYHTLHIVPNSVFHIEKKWRNLEIYQLKKSARVQKINALIVNIDERHSVIAKANESRITPITDIVRQNSGKQYAQSNPAEYFGNVFDAINSHFNWADYLIIAGPGFAPSDFLKFIKEKKQDKIKDLLKNTIVDVTSIVGKTGLNEIIKRGIMDRAIKSSILSEQTKLVENAFNVLAKNPKKIVYGKNYVKSAVSQGAAKQLLISDKIIREQDIEDLIEIAKKKHADVHIIDSHHNAGERLYDLGGLIALLRYEVKNPIKNNI